MSSRTIELLAPARDLETGRVAVDCGADAIYIGGPGFGARHAAENSVEDVAALVRYARPFGVRVYATLNTVLFDDELARAESVARELTDAGVDALIVQDMAWLRMGPTGVEFHASTQTSNRNPEDVAFLGRAGFSRVILERALSLDEIGAIRAATDVELEAFVHGAICVGYSGRCFMSRAMGPRSGNRGNCSQPCRLAWDLTDGRGKPIVKNKHLLSMRDLDLSAHIGELVDAGVSSFKIEGRLKDAGYVRNIVSHYRSLIDTELALRPGLCRASVGYSRPDFTPDPAKSFTRGATDYYFGGAVAGASSFDTPKAMGESLGVVSKTGCERTGNRYFTFEHLTRRIEAGDGICFFADGVLQGTNINRIEGDRVYPNRIDGIGPGTVVYRNYDHAFARALDRSRTKRRISVSATVRMSQSRVSVAFTDETGMSVEVSEDGVFEPARDPQKMLDVLRDELSKSGDTIFEVAKVECLHADELRFIPVSMLAAMRREGLGRLTEAREKLVPQRRPAQEDMQVQFPRTTITAAENVTNRLSEQFYREHGVTEFTPPLELRDSLDGETVMRTRYCIRRESGMCLREAPAHTGEGRLYLEKGHDRFILGFDCAECEMTITKI